MLNPKKISQHRAAAYLLWRRCHAGPRPSSLSKIHTTLIVTLARYSQWHSSLSISSIGFIISFSEPFLQSCCFDVFIRPDVSLPPHLRLIPVTTSWTNNRILYNNNWIAFTRGIYFTFYVRQRWTQRNQKQLSRFWTRMDCCNIKFQNCKWMSTFIKTLSKNNICYFAKCSKLPGQHRAILVCTEPPFF